MLSCASFCLIIILLSFCVIILPSYPTRVAAQVDFNDLLASGVCEEFAQQPLACQGVLVDDWVSIWTVPTFGLTQEYWHAQMWSAIQLPGSSLSLSPLDIPKIYPADCATRYLQLICPSFFRPCTTLPDGSPFLAMPRPVCRSVCLVRETTKTMNEGCIFLHTSSNRF